MLITKDDRLTSLATNQRRHVHLCCSKSGARRHSIFLDLDKLNSQYWDISLPVKEACFRI